MIFNIKKAVTAFCLFGIFINFSACASRYDFEKRYVQQDQASLFDDLFEIEKRSSQLDLIPSVAAVPLPSPKLVLNKEVERELYRYTVRDKYFIPLSIRRGAEDLETIKQIFNDEGVPLELISVGIIESALNTSAKSRAGAVGMWQFVKSTALLYGLSVSWFEDQRKDLILSTIAAARHLRDLYRAFEDWNLALAAYNAGAGAVDRAINRTGSRDFWELSRRGKFRLETRNYVARFNAVALIMQNPDLYGFTEIASIETLEKNTMRAQLKLNQIPKIKTKIQLAK